VKFVISTNLDDLDAVEPALLRDGRCLGAFRFNNLTFKQANVARASIGLPPLPLSSSAREFTLGAALNAVVKGDEVSTVQNNVTALPLSKAVN
jgi:hypothetical protein